MNALAEPGNVATDPPELGFPVPNEYGASRTAGSTVKWWVMFLYALATAQATACYISLVPSYGSLSGFEDGTWPMPFQGRLLMRPLLAWAAHSASVATIAAWSAAVLYPWLHAAVAPDAFVAFVVDALSLAFAGLFTTRLYRAVLPSGRLTALIYPLVLVLFSSTYLLPVFQRVRFPWDLPGLAFSSALTWLVYRRSSCWLFALTFALATLNYETSLLFLVLWGLTRIAGPAGPQWKRLTIPSTWYLPSILGISWALWMGFLHWWFSRTPPVAHETFIKNLYLALHPGAWPQICAACGYLLPIMSAFSRRLKDPVLRAWLWILPAWGTVMILFGLIDEPRVFGGLIPYVACCAALMVESAAVSPQAAR